MSTAARFTFIFLILLSAYHTIRDVLQIMEVRNWFTNVLSYQHNWCDAIAPVCDYYLFPWEVFTFIGSVVVLKRNKIDLLGKAVLYSLIIIPISWALNWILG